VKPNRVSANIIDTAYFVKNEKLTGRSEQ